MVPLSLREGLGGCLTISRDGGLSFITPGTFLLGNFNSNYIASAALSLNTFREGHWVVLKFISLLQILGVQQYPQGGWARYISSGRMSSWTIYFVFGMPFLCWLLPQYPQGGWARHISSVRLSSRIEFCSLYNNFYVGCFHNILREDELVTYPQ